MNKKERLIKEIQSGRVHDEQTAAVFTMTDELREEIAVLKEEVAEAVKTVEETKLDLPKVLESVRGPKGDQGDTPDDDRLKALIAPLIPEPIQGNDGKDGVDGKDGRDGINGLNGVDGKDGKDGIGISGKDGSPDTPEQVRDKLSSLTGEERLSVSAIQGFDIVEKEIKRIDKKQLNGGLSRGAANDTYTKFHNGASNITLATTAPTAPLVGDLWIDTT